MKVDRVEERLGQLERSTHCHAELEHENDLGEFNY